MDAQQRLLLEKSWEALQGAGNAAADASARTSVIVGIGTVDYTSMSSHLGVGIYVATGLFDFHHTQDNVTCCSACWPLCERAV